MKVANKCILVFDDYKTLLVKLKAVNDPLKGKRYNINSFSFMKGMQHYIIKI